jgi:hypothetical protein
MSNFGYGLIDRTGRVMTKPVMEEVYPQGEGLILFRMMGITVILTGTGSLS